LSRILFLFAFEAVALQGKSSARSSKLKSFMNERYIKWWTPHLSRDFEMLPYYLSKI
jgi:hypothetical protein